MFFSPLDQFEIKPLLMVNNYTTLAMTNYTVYLLVVAAMLMGYMSIMLNVKLAGSRWSVAMMSMYDTINSLVKSQMGRAGGMFFPLMFTMFNFMFMANTVSMMPYSFAMSAQVVPMVSFSVSLWLGNVMLGLYMHKWGFFATFVPSGTPTPLVPVLVLIETLSFTSRAMSLGTRLGANMLSGHTLMLILGSLMVSLMSSSMLGFAVGMVPMLAVVAITILEVGMAIMQAYVFSMLLSGYIKDSVSLH
uniref:ATP synthase subunit a n=1 Tax=Candida prachuapensis TaxID=536035 RepID=U3MF38_9ASCO|nr:ATP synthase F0 subunit 6 [Candida prachuapensis]AGW07373.1 ATP synthase F0 subunit 6 [Candida prachuapensis]